MLNIIIIVVCDFFLEVLTGKLILFFLLDDGRVIKILNGASALGDFDSSADEDTRAPVETVIVSETQVLPDGVAVKQIHVALATDKLVVISSEIIRSMPLYHCNNISSCRLVFNTCFWYFC